MGDTGGGAGEPAGTGGGASCEVAVPCGGDVVGTWTVTASCLSLGGELDIEWAGLNCRSATLTRGTLEVRGTWTFHADGTHSDSTHWTGEKQFTIAPECLRMATQASCARLSASDIPSAVGFFEGLAFSSVICVDDPAVPDGCVCTAIIDDERSGESGNYVAADGHLTTDGGAELAYCISGNTAIVTPQKWTEDTSMTTTGTLVLQR